MEYIDINTSANYGNLKYEKKKVLVTLIKLAGCLNKRITVDHK